MGCLLRAWVRQGITISRQKQEIATLSRAYHRALMAVARERDLYRDGFDWIVDVGNQLADNKDGWKSRAEALYLIADPDLRDGVLQVVDMIEKLDGTGVEPA